MELGGFLEMQFAKGREYYKGDIDIARLNNGRMGIWHSFRITGCKRIWIPVYLCDSIRNTFKKKGVKMCFYNQDGNFNPINIDAKKDDAVLLVNYYGIMSNQRMTELAESYEHPIIDCAHAFFCKPIKNAITVYSCRKFVGAPDGAYVLGRNAHYFIDEYQQCYSSDTADFLLKRIEYGCWGKGYEARRRNEIRIDSEDCMRMSKLTKTLMDAEDYEFNRMKRKENFSYAHELFGNINMIDPLVYMDDETVPMTYPLVINNDDLLTKLQSVGYFQWHWWSYICDEQPICSFEHWISRYIIPIAIDQRYGQEELDYIAKVIKGNKYED